MRFDSIDKKPKLWTLAVLFLLTAATVIAIVAVGFEYKAIAVAVIFDVFLLGMIVLLVDAWIRQIRYNPYSYNTIYYIGFALFVTTVFAVQTILTVQSLKYPDLFEWRSSLRVLLDSAGRYMQFSFPFILLYSGALIVSNVSLIRHEGKRLVNILGIILAFLLMAGEMLIFVFNYLIDEGPVRFVLSSLYPSIYLYFECMLIGTIIANIIVVRHEPEKDKDFVIILGCGLRPDGTPTPLLKGRIDRALRFAREQYDATGKQIRFITSGGKGADEIISESRSMKNYLIENGVSEELIYEEDRSTTTMENMRFSKDIIESVDPEAKVIFATTNYHIFRSGTYARKVKMRATGIGAHTKWYFWPNASVREFVSLLTEHRVKQIFVFGGFILFYTILAVAVNV